MLSLKRIYSLATFRQYREGLEKLLEANIAKTKTPETVVDILKLVELACYNPHALNVVVLDEEGSVTGFVSCYLQATPLGRRAIIGHHVFSSEENAKVFFSVMTWMRENWRITEKDVYFLTYRDGPAMARLMSQRTGLPMAVKAYLIGYKEQ